MVVSVYHLWLRAAAGSLLRDARCRRWNGGSRAAVSSLPKCLRLCTEARHTTFVAGEEVRWYHDLL
jgi:hypothetical protein